ncbi:MAG: efflux RND transporter periplasmic adaptor subunit [Acidobacteria bacterium]|nr:efflux RND transporter periplasmic adaptor subunit [Acidobacteriota bacterium]
MNRHASVNVRWTLLAASAAGLLAAGGAATYVVLRTAAVSPGPSGGAETAAVSPPQADHAGHALPATPSPRAPLADVAVSVSPEAVERAGIAVARVGAGAGAAAGLRLPAVVEPNAYRQVAVTPLVSGRVTRVLVELGAQVGRGDAMARIFSPELADAQARDASASAALAAHEQELRRTEKLVEIGAASREELERVRAEHATRTAEAASARSRLELLGAAPGPVHAEAVVTAPIDGVVTERLANAGLNVDASSKLFTVVDLSTVWVVANVYERDFPRVRVGSPATVTMAAYPDMSIAGRVSYIDPQVDAQTRTARLRVEVENPGERLRLGMYADVAIGAAAVEGAADAAPVIPRSAVQTVGDRQVVYLADPAQPGRFTQREVQLGAVSGSQVEVRSGVQAGDAVVAEGSFYLRAERERLGLGAEAAHAAGSSGGSS